MTGTNCPAVPPRKWDSGTLGAGSGTASGTGAGQSTGKPHPADVSSASWRDSERDSARDTGPKGAGQRWDSATMLAACARATKGVG